MSENDLIQTPQPVSSPPMNADERRFAYTKTVLPYELTKA